MIMTLAGLKLQVGRLSAPAGEEVSEQVNPMVPEYVLPVAIVAVVTEVAPAATGGAAGTVITTSETVTIAVPDAMP
jgi:hypothetical protein